MIPQWALSLSENGSWKAKLHGLTTTCSVNKWRREGKVSDVHKDREIWCEALLVMKIQITLECFYTSLFNTFYV